ncbi:MAG: insulinase family protein [Rhodospirillaceae bacterium]|jgi:zinc protease|nr:insulinase family protein [Rhodospirillaceae bacterium]
MWPLTRLFLIVATALLSGVTIFSGAARAAIFNPETFTLKNGMQVVVVSNHRVPVVTHMVWYKVGAMDEPPGKSGLAHYFEHLMFKGTDTLKPGEFSKIVAENGGRENAFTAQDYTGYYQSVAVDRLELMMKIEANRMTRLVLTEDIIKPERQVILEERSSRTDNNPAAQLSEQTATALFMNHPYRIPVIGWSHEIKALTLADLTTFYRQWYRPNNAILVVSGDITAAQVRPLAEKYYGVIPAKPLPARVDWKEPPLLTDRRITLTHDRVRQPAWSRRFPAPSARYGDATLTYPLQVLAEILSGGATSRLYKSLVVDAKIASSAGAWYDDHARGPSVFGFYASPAPGSGAKDAAKNAIDGVERGMITQLDKLIADGVTDMEVQKAINRLQASAIYARDSYRTPARILGGALAIGLSVADVEAWPERIGAVTTADVNKAVAAIFKDKRSITTLLLPKRKPE